MPLNFSLLAADPWRRFSNRWRVLGPDLTGLIWCKTARSQRAFKQLPFLQLIMRVQLYSQ